MPEESVFSVANWLAGQLHCGPHELSLVDLSDDGRDALYAVRQEPYLQVHVLGPPEPDPTSSIGLIAAWPGGSGRIALRAGTRIEW